MKALFLDRDGIINIERGDYTWKKEDFRFTEHLFPFLRSAVDKGFKIIVITNQGGINKNLYQKDNVDELHQWMIEQLAQEGIDILDVFYCPHHSDFQKCLCRKPGSLLLEKASAIYHIDPSISVMIGDRQRDVDAASASGIKGILLESNPDWNEVNLELE